MVSSRETLETLFDIVPTEEPISIRLTQPQIDSFIILKSLSIVVPYDLATTTTLTHLPKFYGNPSLYIK